MKFSALKQFRKKLASKDPVYGMWVTLESPSITEIGVALGLDWIVIDAEHGHLDWDEIVAHVRAGVRSDTVVLVRIAELNVALVKRALDIGADGVVIPWIENVEQLRTALSYAHYPPNGIRGIGAERATAWGQSFAEHAAEADSNVLIVPIIETVQAGRNIQSMLSLPGIEMFFLGPADYSATAGFPGQWEGPGVAEQLLQIKDQISAAGKYCGVMTSSIDNLKLRREQGFKMLGLGLDSGLLLRSLHETLRSVDRDQKIHVELATGEAMEKAASSRQIPRLPHPPESMRPDRDEIITKLGAGKKVMISPGVSFECQVGSFNQARNLTTGIVTFSPSAVLPYHSHTFAETVTLLSGAAEMIVEERSYKLSPLDNVTIPAGLAHCVRNLSRKDPAKFHIAMNTDNPTRTNIERFFSTRSMPATSTGVPGKERVTRIATAHRFAAGPNTQFIDYFNAELVPGLQMSGGYGAFSHQGRLPAHVHDFDESICIIEGEATCVVEGRRYSMSDFSTALQPRGRVHYFINDTQEQMAMIWVYAGPMPERIVVEERNATAEGNPWRSAK